MKTVVAFGETLWDLLPTGPVLGGAPANFAYRVNSLGDRGIIVTRLGRDDLGKKAFDQLASLGMDTSHVQWDGERPTGTVLVTVDSQGVPDFTIVKDVAYDFMSPVEATADAFCFGTLIQRSGVSRRALWKTIEASPSALRFFDINLRKECYTKETIESSLDQADVLKLNDSEAQTVRRLFGLPGGTAIATIARELRRRWSLDACVVTLGEKGSFAVTANDEAEVGGWNVDVVDTIGSGDAFSAAFLHCWMKGRPLADCLYFGNALGAMVARTKGATAPVSVDEIHRFCGRSL